MFNKKIKEQIDVVTRVLPIDEAKKLGAAMQFGEKYGDIVRVVDVGSWSMEFCGGTHVKKHIRHQKLYDYFSRIYWFRYLQI